MDIENLIEQLNDWNEKYISNLCGDRTIKCEEYCIKDDCLIVKAATALSTLRAENEKLREKIEDARLEGYAKGLGEMSEENEKLRVELEQVKEERDEAVQCIRGIAKSGRVWMCPYCVHAKDTTGGIAECELDVGVCMMPYSKFEWDGQKED